MLLIKFNSYINKFKLIRVIKWILYHIFRSVIKFEYLIYKKFNKSKKIRRLFSTSGNISLINSLAIINEIGNFDKYEDTLLIDTGKGELEFINYNLELAKFHNFKKIIVEPKINPGMQLVLNNFFKIDKLYILNCPIHFKSILCLYPNIPIYLIDEGPGSLVNCNSDKIKNLQSFKTHKYIGKLDFCNFDDISKIKFEQININEFKKIAEELSKKYPIKIKTPISEKTILYCGMYWEVSGLDKETFTKTQNKTVNNLLNAGYKILYKPHPRDTEFYGLDKNPNVEFITSKLPIELYNLDILAIVSLSSSTSISPSHYWGIPGFCNVLDEALLADRRNININRYIIREYSPNYGELLKLDVKNTTRDELKRQIKNIYDVYLKDKPLLSENENVNEYIKKVADISLNY